VLGAFAVSVVGAVAFWVVERRSDHPLVHFSLFRNKPYLAGFITTFAQGFGLLAFLYFIAIYAESFAIYDETPLGAGLLLLPGGLVMFVSALVGGRVADRIGYRGPNTLGMALIALGAFALMAVGPDTSIEVLAAISCVTAAGVGIGFSTTSAAGMAAVDQEVSGEAAGVINVALYLGAVLVVALGTVVMLQVSQDELTTSLDAAGVSATETIDLDQALSETSADLEAAIEDAAPGQEAEVQAYVADATNDGFRGAELMVGVVLIGATGASWVLLRGEKQRAKAFPHRGPVAHAVSH
jgi:predicted MFS family arabinose efflux permease